MKVVILVALLSMACGEFLQGSAETHKTGRMSPRLFELIQAANNETNTTDTTPPAVTTTPKAGPTEPSPSGGGTVDPKTKCFPEEETCEDAICKTRCVGIKSMAFTNGTCQDKVKPKKACCCSSGEQIRAVAALTILCTVHTILSRVFHVGL